MKKIMSIRIVFGAIMFAGLIGLALAVHSQGAAPTSPPAAAAPALSLDQVIAKLQDNYKIINSYQTDFEQQLWSTSQSRVVSQGEGAVIYKKPSKMVWHYVKPEEHFYITDGSTIYDYAPADKTAYVLSVKDAVYKAYLLGLGDIKKDFEVSFHSGRAQTSAGFYQVDLVPKNKDERDAVGVITLIVDPGNFLVKQTESVDALGNRNMIKFKNQKMNPALDDARFKFNPPPGTQVIKGESATPVKPK